MGGVTMKVKIFIKKLGKNRKNVEPVCYDYPDTIHTVKDLIKETVHINFEEYKKGHENKEVFQILTKEEMKEQKEAGKITFGIPYDFKEADYEEAVENAWQCLEDGIVVLFVDGEKLEKLEDKVLLKENSELIFIRMTMLAGRMW